MIVISDTSAITNLAAIGQLQLLPQLCNQVSFSPRHDGENYAVRKNLSTTSESWEDYVRCTLHLIFEKD